MTNPIVETGREAAEVIKIPEGPPAPGASVPGRRHPPSSLEKEWRTLQELGLGSSGSLRDVRKDPVPKPSKHNDFMANGEAVSEYDYLPHRFLFSFSRQVHCNT